MKVACIDLDNTLANTSKMHLTSFKRAFAYYKLKPVPDKRILHLFGLISEDMIKKLYPGIDEKLIPKIVNKHNEIATKSTYKFAKKIKGSNEALVYLKSKGFKVVILSNSSLREVRIVLRQAGIRKDNYLRIITKDDLKKGKPSPEGINLAKKIFNASEAIIVGDTPYDILAGRSAANTKTIGVLTGTHPRTELRKYKPDFIMNSIAEIKKVI